MRVMYLAGWALLVLAFLAAAFETAARGRFGGDVGLIMTSYEVWTVYWPNGLRALRAWVEGVHWSLWDPMLVTLLRLPGWALLGLPGIFLVLRHRPVRESTEEIDEDQMFMFDRLAKRARDEGYADEDDDIYTHHLPQGDIDPAGATGVNSPDDYLDDFEPPGPGDRGKLPPRGEG